ncbi:hypothetical protein BTO05_04675 [Winogradskyella sp. PC-19]|uniref:ABC transporter ATP-binding protein n=1 Tax=unclassified Winogradskyella TaxID=2615021 RepID=UPI000B3C4CD2|nr:MULTISPECIES: ABC transporter ATP-binding protein [unclassified Winogradskyella]ARV08962.1 hypothetical protein BTO05_04675 [Winogradskyella sp. PC-19]
MSSEIILKVSNLSKQYRLGLVGASTLVDDLKRFWYRVRGKENPFLKIGDDNDRSSKGNSDYVWALKDINFEVNRGEVLGIIGKNGAGKSTLLKILSRVTAPTTGKVQFNGRIASLLEVGTGFHQELTGRENVFLNGAILGMTKSEISDKLDEIIEFSGCERYIDTPVKRYSSGMTVRLAFAVAAFLEPDILVIDEVLAVGDAEFQKKAVGKMQDISRGEGRTVLFVSHNMVAIDSLCTRALLIENGNVVKNGDVSEVIKQYLKSNQLNSRNNGKLTLDLKKKDTHLKEVNLYNSQKKLTDLFYMGEAIHFELFISNAIKLNNIKASIIIKNSNDIKVSAIRSHEMLNHSLEAKSNFILNVKIDDFNLMPGEYILTFALANSNETIEIIENALSFVIQESDVFKTGKIPFGGYLTYNHAKWELKEH